MCVVALRRHASTLLPLSSASMPNVLRSKNIRSMESSNQGQSRRTFPEPRLCKAVVDGLTFNAHIVESGIESWRFKKTL
jgi:hypothetical protein